MTNGKEDNMDELISFEIAANYAQVPLRTIQHAARKGYLETLTFSPRRKLTTRKKVDCWLRGPHKRYQSVKKT